VIDYAGVSRSYGQVRGMLSAAAVNETEIFRVTVTSPDPQEAERIANSIAYADRMPPDFSTVLMKDYMAIDKDYRAKLMQIPAFVRWLSTKGRLINGAV
jgi:capsular polysaccharide biosynthesis protein